MWPILRRALTLKLVPQEGLVAWAGSLKVTLALMLLLLFLVLIYNLLANAHPLLIELPLLLLSLNLLAAIIRNSTFRRQPPLLVFHLSLLTLLLLIALGRLSFLKGEAEVTVGETFTGQLVTMRAGPLHMNSLESVKFHLEDFSIQYEPDPGGISRGATHSRISWINSSGEVAYGVIGDHRPYIQNGYRFYTTSNKGFAPLFIWQPYGGEPRQGAIHLPSWPANEHNQAIEWSVPGTDHQLWTQLQFDEVILDSEKPSRFRLPKEYLLAVRVGAERYELHPGQAIDFSDGRLTFKELRTWMGFSVFYDWTLPWLFASGLIAALSLGWYYWGRFADHPWDGVKAV